MTSILVGVFRVASFILSLIVGIMATEDYFSIDDILSAEPRLYCTFRVRGHLLGHLDPIGVQAAVQSQPLDSASIPSTATETASASATTSATTSASLLDDDAVNDVDDDPTNHIPTNHRLALPFWLAETLAERNLVSLHLPHCFKTTVRNALRADAPSVHLHRLCPSYYALGVRISKLVKDISLPATLVRAFASRCWPIVDQAAFASNRGSRALVKLDLLERRLFFEAHSVAAAIVRWKERSCDRISAFPPLLGKRPRPSDAPGTDAVSPVTPSTRSRVRVC